MKLVLRLLALAAAVSLVAAACGDDDDDTSGGGATTTEAQATTTAEDTAGDDAPDGDTADGDTAGDDTVDGDTAGDDTADEEIATDDLIDTAVASGEFPTLVAAVEAAGLVDTLRGPGPFTVFAPTEDAFADLLADLGIAAEDLLTDTELLTSVLTYHVVPGAVLAADVVGLDGTDVTTVNGATVAISADGDTVRVGDATVVATDISASNGVIHVIDTVLLPPA